MLLNFVKCSRYSLYISHCAKHMSKKFKSDACWDGAVPIGDLSYRLESLTAPVKSPADKKTYSVFKLNNGLITTIISDVSNIVELNKQDEEDSEEAEIDSEYSTGSSDNVSCNWNPPEEKLAACSLTVGVGSFSDPEHIPGLAHFLEHMVFMGSEKYPTENEFDSFITKHGGFNNASTSCEHTTFYFECQEKHLQKAMDIFSQFFKSPLMKKEAMTRERQAIESEFNEALSSDENRKQQIMCTFASKTNPARKFTWGNEKTLKENIQDDDLYRAVHEFRNKHYSAHRMTLAVQARLPVDTLKNYVISSFSQVLNNNIKPDTFETLVPFENFSKKVYVEAIKTNSTLDFTWILPTVYGLYKTKPLHYVSHLLGHEGENSLLSYLRRKNWAVSLGAGFGEEDLFANHLYTAFTITMVLTDLGKDNTDEISKAIFSYLKMLKTTEPQRSVYDEIQAVANIDFKYQEEIDPSENVEGLSERMQLYPSEHYICGELLYFEFDPECIKKFINLLNPSNVNIMITSKGLVDKMILDQEEVWFKTKYTTKDITKDEIDFWEKISVYPDFAYPKKNHFIADDFSLLTSEATKYPQKIKSTDIMDVWYKGDNKFNLPVAFIGIQIATNKTFDLHSCAWMSLYTKILMHSVKEDLYPAMNALYDYKILNTDYGICITVYGCSQKLHLVVEKIAEKMTVVDEKVYRTMHESLLRETYNALLDTSVVAKDLRMAVLDNKFFSHVDLYCTNIGTTYHDLVNFVDSLFKSVFVQCLVQGNLTEEQSVNICDKFVQKICCSGEKNLTKRTISKLEGQKCLRVRSFDQNTKNSVTTNYYQFGPGKLKNFLLLELFVLMMEEPLFDELRTKQQLGYSVSCSVRDTYGILGFTMTVGSQIDKFSMDEIEQSMTNFLHIFLNTLKATPDEEFENAKETLLKTKRTVDLKLEDEAIRNFKEIKSMEYFFDRIEKEIEIIPTLKKKSLLRSLEKNILKPGFKKLTLQVVGTSDTEECAKNEVDFVSGILLPRNVKFDTIQFSSLHSNDYFIKEINSFRDNLDKYPPSKLVP